MRTTAVQLLKVKPIPASAIQSSLRLPPSTSASKASSITAASKSTRPASADVAAELEKKVVAGQEFGSNVRISSHINNKDLYWKVSAEWPERIDAALLASLSSDAHTRGVLDRREPVTQREPFFFFPSLLLTGLKTSARRSEKASKRGIMALTNFKPQHQLVLVPTI
jgi:hypothetical protein